MDLRIGKDRTVGLRLAGGKIAKEDTNLSRALGDQSSIADHLSFQKSVYLPFPSSDFHLLNPTSDIVFLHDNFLP